MFFTDIIDGVKKERLYPNIVSARYKSKNSARRGLNKYLTTGKIEVQDEK